MKTNHTDITVVLDRSGSMSSVVEDTIGGFNRFLDDQRKSPGTATITLHQFDDLFETPIKAQDVKAAPDLTSQTFVPRGNTALLDAIGRAISDTGSRMEAAVENERAEKVVFVIVTDGHENASHEYNHGKVFEMIEHQRAKYSWAFVFLGANQDAIKVASSLGMHAGSAMKYSHNPAGTQAAFASTGKNVSAMRSTMNRIGGQSVSLCQSLKFTDEDREEQLKAQKQP